MKKINMRKVVNGSFTASAITNAGLQVGLRIAPHALKFIPGVGTIVTVAQGVTLATAAVKAGIKVADSSEKISNTEKVKEGEYNVK